jgi:hypothetical protein
LKLIERVVNIFVILYKIKLFMYSRVLRYSNRMNLAQQEIGRSVNITAKLEKFSESLQGDQGESFCVFPCLLAGEEIPCTIFLSS